MRRPLGFGLIIAGGLTLSFTGGRYALGAVKADRARQEWDAAAAKRAVVDARAEVARGARVRAIEGSPVARLVIPRIGLDEIVLEGVSDDDLNALPGHVPGSALPGDPGNAVISAHRDRHFRRLGDVVVGDTILSEAGSRQARWVVVNRRVIDKDAPALFRTTDATLTLTTCWPIRYFGSAPERLIITAKPLAG